MHIYLYLFGAFPDLIYVYWLCFIISCTCRVKLGLRRWVAQWNIWLFQWNLSCYRVSRQ